MLSLAIVMLSAGTAREDRAEVSAPLPRCPAAPLAGGFFRKIAGTIAMVIISKIAQMVRRSMDSVHEVKGQGRIRPGETDGSEPDVGPRASSPGVRRADSRPPARTGSRTG